MDKHTSCSGKKAVLRLANLKKVCRALSATSPTFICIWSGSMHLEVSWKFDLLPHGLSRLGTSECISSVEAVAQKVCSLDSYKCNDRVCDICGITESDPTDHLFEGLDEDDSMSYYQWHKVEGVVKKHLVDCTIAEAKEDLQVQQRPLF